MKRCLTAFLFVLSFLGALASGYAEDSVNAVIADTSWQALHGGLPIDAAEVDRIRTHLLFVADFLEAHPPNGLRASTRERRAELLGELRDYAMAGEFPQRVEDGYAGRRPRFIDDRGVHCAVGELMRRSGHGLMAEAVNAVFEYAYIGDIPTTEMTGWASDHGFTIAELAMIQPTYSPSPRSVESRVRGNRSSITLKCLKDHPDAPKVVRLRVVQHPDLRIEFSLAGASDSAFASCFLDQVRNWKLTGRHPMKRKPEPFDAVFEVPIPSPQQIVSSRLKRFSVVADARDCAPRPGPLARRATLRVTNQDGKFSVAVETQPSNPEVEQCLKQQVARQFAYVRKGGWPITAEAEVGITPQFRPVHIEISLIFAIRKACPAPTIVLSDMLEARVIAITDRPAIEVEMDGVEDSYRECVERVVKDEVERRLSVQRKSGDKDEPYFRIDADVTWTLTYEHQKSK